MLEKVVSPREQCSPETATGKVVESPPLEISTGWLEKARADLVTVLLHVGGWTREIWRAPQADTAVIL